MKRYLILLIALCLIAVSAQIALAVTANDVGMTSPAAITGATYTAESTSDSLVSSNGQTLMQNKPTKAEVSGQAIDPARLEGAVMMVDSSLNKKAEANTLISMVAEVVSSYRDAKTLETPVEANYIVTKSSEVNAGGMGGIALVWQNGGGPTVGVAPIIGSETVANSKTVYGMIVNAETKTLAGA